MYTAKISFYKYVQHNNFEMGCTGNNWMTYNIELYLDFSDTDDLIQGMSQWVSENFEVTFDDAHKHMNYNCEPNKFDYSQNEDAEGFETILTKEKPDGYLANYEFYVDDVFVKIDYDFTKGGEK